MPFAPNAGAVLEGDPSAKRKSKQEFSVSAKVLEELRDAHPFVPLLMRHRKLTHFVTHSGDMGGYGPGWAREGRGICRLRPSYQQTNVETGRVVTENPNLQCVPRMFPDNPQPGDLVLNPRAGFVASRGHVLLAADYRQARRAHFVAVLIHSDYQISLVTQQPLMLLLSCGASLPLSALQLELRIMAHFSGDQRLLAAFRGGAQQGADPFIQLAAQWQSKAVAEARSGPRAFTLPSRPIPGSPHGDYCVPVLCSERTLLRPLLA